MPMDMSEFLPNTAGVLLLVGRNTIDMRSSAVFPALLLAASILACAPLAPLPSSGALGTVDPAAAAKPDSAADFKAAAASSSVHYVRLESATDALPEADREFRGVWVASVANIDWPSRPGLTTVQQQAELRELLTQSRNLGLNAVVLQVRPAADALYPSNIEPWSEYLTGEQGRAPQPLWDPLSFAIAEAHARGLELHAWFNPFRARHSTAKSPAAPTHVSRSNPSLVVRYGTQLWMDPGLAAVQDQAMRVVLDVVRRYDVDGVHIDDYFYPYPERDRRGRLIPFPDDASYSRYRSGGGKLTRDDWRRNNVDRFVERLYGEVKETKPWVKVGISPFGIWRPGHPQGVQGLDAYSSIYADARRWVREGWLDYVSPQLYWPMGRPQQDYRALLGWWVQENPLGRHVWPGNYTSQVQIGRQAEWTPQQIGAQIDATREQRGAQGNIHFSMKAFLADERGLSDFISREVYPRQALVPAFPWLTAPPPPRPGVVVQVRDRDAGEIHLGFPLSQNTATWLVRARYGDEWTIRLVPGSHDELTLLRPLGSMRVPDLITISAVDRVGREGLPDVHVLRQGLAGATGAGTGGMQPTGH